MSNDLRQRLKHEIEQFRAFANAYREDAGLNGGPNPEGKRLSDALAQAYEQVVQQLEPLVEDEQ